MEQFKEILKVFVAVGVLGVFLVGNASARSGLCSQENLEQRKFTVWVPGPPSGASTIIAGPGIGGTDILRSGYGSLAVFDAPILDGPDETNSTEVGRNRGMFLVDAKDGTNLLTVMTFDFANYTLNGSTVVTGTMALSGEPVILPILGGTETFSCSEGFIYLTATGKPPGREFIESLFKCEFHITVPK